jgi:hypothetical protein
LTASLSFLSLSLSLSLSLWAYALEFLQYTGRPLFKAFEGLSYTTFDTSCRQQWSSTARGAAQVSIGDNTTLTLSCTVRNTGKRDGDAVILLFHRPPAATLQDSESQLRQRPIRRLIDFDRATVPAGGSAEVPNFVVRVPEQLLLVGEDGSPLRVPGVHVIEVQDGPSFNVTL